MSERSQQVVVWWAAIFTILYGICIVFLLHMVPPPHPTEGANEIAAFYADNRTSILVGAVICSYCSAFMLPLAVVIAIQTARLEKGNKIWSALIIAAGAMMSIFLVLPPLMWGTAAFNETRSPDITLLLHELSMLTLITTDAYYIFMWVGIVVICFMPTNVPFSPFPRWFGWMTLWIAIMFEAGAIAFFPKSGAFSWVGIFPFWSPLTLFGIWIATACNLLLRAIKAQRLAGAGTVTEEQRTATATFTPQPAS